MLTSGLALGLLASITSFVTAEDRPTIVDLGYSQYRGMKNTNGVTRWCGVRYAAAPVGDLRFRAPQDPLSTGNQVIAASSIQKACLSSPTSSYNSSLQSEDCLFLDVYTPSENKKKLPVYVWIQGGGLNTQGANTNGSNLILASGYDMVFVSFNYRVGVFGFLSSKEVRANGNLNNGLLDQRKVLHWVQSHIAKFGGDPKKVIIAGSSAGAGSVGTHMTAYGGKDQGLFGAVHAESPSFGYVRTVAESQYQYDGLVSQLNCSSSRDTLSCLRAASADTIASNNLNLNTPGGAGGQPVFMWSNCIDGDLIRDQTYRQFGAGNFTKVPVIYGADTDEGTVFTRTNINSVKDMNAFFKDNFPWITDSQLAVVDNLYPKAEQYTGKGSYFSATADAYGQMRYMCSSLNVTALLTDAGVSNVYQYHYAVYEDADEVLGLGTRHAQAIGPFWGTSTAGSRAAGVSPWMQAYLLSFIKTVGNPNTYRKAGSPVWSKYNERSMKRMLFPNDPSKIAMETVSDQVRMRCSYWSMIGPSIGQ